MCFSAEASFTAGAVLTVMGGVALKKFHEKDECLLAVIPLLFGFQQFAEGFVWLGLLNPDAWGGVGSVAKWVFLLFALFFWPAYSALAVYRIEHEQLRKKLILLCGILGMIVGIYATTKAIMFGIPVDLCNNHIRYTLYNTTGTLNQIMQYLYALAVVAPFFITLIPGMWLFGLIQLVEFLYVKLSAALQKEILSVWCFLAAVASVLLIYILYNRRAKRLAGEKNPE